MADDPYKALGLAKSASADEIKKAYRKIAKTDHPDLNPDPAAHERFKAASSAYDLLKDPDQRARFDRGEIDAQGQERPQRHYYREYAEAGDNPYRQEQGFDDLSGVFSDLFGQRAGAGGGRRGGARSFDMRGPDQRFTLLWSQSRHWELPHRSARSRACRTPCSVPRSRSHPACTARWSPG